MPKEHRLDEDAALVERCLEGDEKAYTALFEEYRDLAYRVALRYLHQKEDALDAVQDAFVKAFKALDRFRGEASLKTWLLRIVTNTCLDRMKGKQLDQVEFQEEATEALMMSQGRRTLGTTPIVEIERKELSEKIGEAVADLDELHRGPFVLHVMEGLAYKDIAEVLEISIGTVMSRIFYARQKLKTVLERYVK